MKLDEIVAWYQKKIGTYDKQQWEKTVEQKIIDGFTSFTLKNAKLKTEFIDVDLVRGSTFPKAKPKQSLLTVIRLAILRYFLFPIYAQWWVKQTSTKIFGILLFVYIAQMINWALYCLHAPARSVDHDSEHIISIAELLIPMTLSFFLSLIHSQIVATNSVSGLSTKRKRYCNANGKPRERIRRRKKLVKLRNQESNDPTSTSTISSRGELQSSGLQNCCSSKLILTNLNSASNLPTSSGILTSSPTIAANEHISKFQFDFISNNDIPGENVCIESNNKKRNVNFAAEFDDACSSKKILFSTTSSDGDDPTQSQLDKSVLEFYDDLVSQTDEILSKQRPSGTKRSVGEDDGFESLNGKSSSGEEFSPSLGNNKLDNLTTSSQNALRFRLNGTGNCNGNGLNVESSSQIKSDDLGKISGNRRKCLFSSESDYGPCLHRRENEIFLQKKGSACSKKQQRSRESSDTDEEGDDGDPISSPSSLGVSNNYVECTTSATEWLGITTNSEECSYSSELENSDCYRHTSSNNNNNNHSDDDDYDLDFTPATILNAHGSSDRISCTVWEQQEIKKAEMSVLDIASCIIDRVEAMPETCDYIFIGVFSSIVLSLIPCFCRLCEMTVSLEKATEISYFEVPMLIFSQASFSFTTILRFAFGETGWERTILIIGFIQRLCLTFILFFLFAVAERTFKQRFLYAKLFSHLTSSRRARKSNLPHFRLNKVRNIKTWLSVRSYLKKRGPQRSVDVIVSAAFIVTLFLLSFLSVEWLKDSVQLHSRLDIEALLWSAAIVIFLLRFMTLGNKINRKYRSISVLITEQINLYLQIEQKPKKKDELMVSNSVLKLAGDLLKELESPFQISGLSANPYLFTTIKVVILSALSGVLSEILGFKLKLHKIKIK